MLSSFAHTARTRSFPAKVQWGGHSLLELLMATSITAVALVPTLSLMRRSMEVARRIERHDLVTTLAVSTLEEQLAQTAAQWSEATDSGTFASQGYSTVRYAAERSMQSAEGGLPDQLMVVTVTVWEDANANATADAREVQASLRSKVAKVATYQAAAAGE